MFLQDAVQVQKQWKKQKLRQRRTPQKLPKNQELLRKHRQMKTNHRELPEKKRILQQAALVLRKTHRKILPGQFEEKVESGEITQGWNSIVLYDIDLNGIQVKRADDGIWYDENGVSYGDLDNADESQPIVNENGEIWYWNGDLAEQAAEENSDNSSEDSSGTEDISDPFDLYSWDAGTGQYIPFQQAETDASPVGRGNGWYYYDEESSEFLPW